MNQVQLQLVTGESLTAVEALEEVEKALSDAARSGQSRLAWLTEAGTDRRIGVNPAHVVTLRIAGDG